MRRNPFNRTRYTYMKQYFTFNSIAKSRMAGIIRIITTAMLVMMAVMRLTAASGARDEISIYASTSETDDGKFHVTCKVVNESKHTLVWGALKFGNCGFQICLLDENDRIVLQNAKWAEAYGQEGTFGYTHPRGMTGSNMKPAEQVGFEFDLEEAYGERAALGRKLLVVWVGAQLWDDVKHEVPSGIDANGNPLEPHLAKVEFPRDWKLTITVPIQKTKNSEGQTLHKSPTAIPPSNSPVSNADSPRSFAPVQPTVSASSAYPSNSWWWSILAIPVLLLAWLVLRLRSQP